MNVFQARHQDEQWYPPLPDNQGAQLVLVFGSKELIEKSVCQQELMKSFPCAEIIACSSSGEILEGQVYDNSLTVTAITFEQISVEVYSENIDDFSDEEQAGAFIASQLNHDKLKHVLVFADGQKVNGSALVNGIEQVLPSSVAITGGLAADGANFEKTWLWHNDKTESGMLVVCGLYGDNLHVGYSHFGGWTAFGPDRLITKSKGNTLYELDGESALQLYKRYLDSYAKDLPSSALLFPLFIHPENEMDGVVRTVLNIDETENSMIFAGDIQEGSYAQLMFANQDRLVDGAEIAAKNALMNFTGTQPSLALLVSCVGRRLALNQRVEEELDVVNDIFGNNVLNCGFYSYGEISPLIYKNACALHNQTVTITLFSEI